MRYPGFSKLDDAAVRKLRRQSREDAAGVDWLMAGVQRATPAMLHRMLGVRAYGRIRALRSYTRKRANIMKFKNKPVVIEAQQFWKDKPLPFWDLGPVVAFMDGAFYVTTTHGQSALLDDGDWVILEPERKGAPPLAAYPCKPDVFAARYEAVPHLVMVCGVDCHPGDAVCNNYCNEAPQKGPMALLPPPGPDAAKAKGTK